MEKHEEIKKEDLYMTTVYEAWHDVQKSISNLQKFFAVENKESNFGKKTAKIHKQK